MVNLDKQPIVKKNESENESVVEMDMDQMVTKRPAETEHESSTTDSLSEIKEETKSFATSMGEDETEDVKAADELPQIMLKTASQASNNSLSFDEDPLTFVSTISGTEPVSEQINEQIYNPMYEPITQVEEITEPITEEIDEPIVEPMTDSEKDEILK